MSESDPMRGFKRAVEAKQLKISHDRGNEFQMECPAHDDRNPSVSVKWSGDKVLVNCHTGCDVRDIVAELGLTMEDLFESEPDREKNKVVVARYPYIDGRTGEVLFTKVRYFPKTFAISHYDNSGEERWGIPEGVKPWLYHAQELREGLDAGVPVWLVEGEADVHAMEALGAVATTQPMGAGPGKWKPFHTMLLQRASEVRIVVDLDDDRVDRDGNTVNVGRDYALEVRDALMSAGIKVTLWKAGAGKDASDHLRAGLKLDQFGRYLMPQRRPPGTIGSALMLKAFKPLVYAVEDILPQGVAILGAPPKGSKSFMTLDWAIGVATGGRTMSTLQCTLGDVLYVGLEDSERRIQDRVRLLTGGQVPDLSRIEFQTIESGWEPGLAGMASMEEWATSVETPRMVVLDTLAKAEPELGDEKDRYRAEYALTTRYKKFADRHDLTVVFVHHDKKSADDDWMKRFSGTQGLTGGVDTLLLIDSERGTRDGFLRVDGRDVKADDIPIRKPHGLPFWLTATAPESPRSLSGSDFLNDDHRFIINFVRSGGAVSWDAIKNLFDEERQAFVAEWVDELVSAGVLESRGNRYRVKDHSRHPA